MLPKMLLSNVGIAAVLKMYVPMSEVEVERTPLVQALQDAPSHTENGLIETLRFSGCELRDQNQTYKCAITALLSGR